MQSSCRLIIVLLYRIIEVYNAFFKTLLIKFYFAIKGILAKFATIMYPFIRHLREIADSL